jgi:predicted ATP-grasp superfamily ATP-dependent carboligase
VTEPTTVALFGASVRWLAQSASRAGFRVLACDLFADDDTREFAETRRIDASDYPAGFIPVAEKWADFPRVYTGGLENYPEVVERFAQTGPLWGCAPASLRACRRSTALQECGVQTPRVALDAAGVPTDRSWLLKPLRGSAGRGIRTWDGGRLPVGWFLQERVDGEPCSASFLALADRTLVLGAASQFIGESWTGAPPFAYAGGIAPLDPTSSVFRRLTNVGDTIRSRFGLRGLFGIDAVRCDDEWTFLEINPRPTASMELFEAAGAGSIFERHRSAFDAEGEVKWKAGDGSVAGKAILYAEASCRLDQALPSSDDGVLFADRPAAGTAFEMGDPVATALATGDSHESVRRRLERGLAELRRRLVDE